MSANQNIIDQALKARLVVVHILTKTFMTSETILDAIWLNNSRAQKMTNFYSSCIKTTGQGNRLSYRKQPL